MNILLTGRPITAKNSQTVINVGGRRIPMKSKALRKWEAEALPQARPFALHIDYPVNVEVKVWVYRNGRCDLVGYIQAVLDLLVKAGVMVDDSGWAPAIAVSYDGSRIMGVDKDHPRIHVEITAL